MENTPRTRRRIYLVRHGDVTYFDSDGKPFRPDRVPLNADGRRQAKALARELACIPIDRIVTSDLPRCQETVAILIAGRSLRAEPREELREIRPGRLADLSAEEVETAFLRAFDGFHREAKFLGGETLGSLADRVTPCFRGLVADPNWRHLLIVAHGSSSPNTV